MQNIYLQTNAEIINLRKESSHEKNLNKKLTDAQYFKFQKAFDTHYLSS